MCTHPSFSLSATEEACEIIFTGFCVLQQHLNLSLNFRKGERGLSVTAF